MADEKDILDQIKEQQRLISVRQISISIGELISWHEKKKILLNPTYQRKFRWDKAKQSKLIESIILGLPLPSIFLYAASHNKYYEVMDGLQRITTLLDFFSNGLKLQELKVLTELNGLTRDKIPFPIEFDLEGSRLDLQILNQTDSDSAKYELFIRLNSGGIALTPQEVRNCILDQESAQFTSFLKKIAEDDNFETVTQLSDPKSKKGTLEEWALRFILLQDDTFRTNLTTKGVKVNDWITDSALELIKTHKEAGSLDSFLEATKDSFIKTFALLNSCDDPLRKQRGTSLRAFELVAISLGCYLHKKGITDELTPEKLNIAIAELWKKELDDERDTSSERSNFRTWNNVHRGLSAFESFFAS
jgi:hypothetical protein